MISVNTKSILATEEVIIVTLKVVSSTTKLILAIEEVTTATLKFFCFDLIPDTARELDDTDDDDEQDIDYDELFEDDDSDD